MKLQLGEHRGIPVLTVEGSIAGHHAKVLRAGIAKLFKDGKNRLVLDVKPPPVLDEETVRELGVLNVLARELSGEVVLVIADPAAREKVQNFGKPNPVKCFAAMADALGAFQSAPAAPAAAVDRDEELEKLDVEIRKLKEFLRAKESGGEVAAIRADNARLKTENAELADRLEKMMVQRRAPADEAGYQEKIRVLESEVTSLMAQVQKLESERKKSS